MQPIDDDATAGAAKAKQALRERVQAARSARPEAERRAEDRARAEALGAWLAGFERVALYFSRDPEPDVAALLDRLPGTRILLPVLGRRPDGTPRREPDWAWYGGPDAVRVGLWGIQEPTTPSLGADALAEVDAVVCSGVAADLAGWRCGVGGGWYDRALAHARPGVPIVIALNETEVVEAVPHERHDRRVDGIATGRGLRWIGPGDHRP